MISTVPEGLKRDAKRPRAWREARLVCVDDPERTRRQYGLSFEPVDHSTAQWGHCARLVGRAQSTRMYIVADEANWIERICAQTFGDDARLLVDFYHVSEYLVDASHARRPSKPKQWLQPNRNDSREGSIGKLSKS